MNNVFGYYRSGYRVFSSYWWKSWVQPRMYYLPLVWAWQRVTRGWADCDTWSLDNHLAEVIPEALRHLRKTKHGTPMDMTEEQWDQIIQQIIEGFEAYQKADDVPDVFIRQLGTSTGWRASLGIKDSVYDWEGIKIYQEAQLGKFRQGMKLFTEHFQSLWD